MPSAAPPVARPDDPSAASPWWRALNSNQWFVFSVASLAWVFDCLDQQVFNLARDGAMEALLRDKARAAEFAPYTTSVFLVGWAIGGLIFGALGDRYGRARMLTLTILIYSLTTGLNAFATGFFDFSLYRFITGLGVGGVFGLSVALVADSVPDRARAPALGLLQSLSTWGNLTAALIGMAIGAMAARHRLPFGLAPWQTLFLVGALPALLSVLVLSRLEEPMKWQRARAEAGARGIRFGSYAALLGHPRWKRHAWFGLIACSSGIVGLWGIGNFHPMLTRDIVARMAAGQGLTADALAAQKAYWSSAGLLLQNVGGFLGMLSLAKLAQTWGRRKAFATALGLSFATTWLVFKGMRTTTDMYWMLPLMGFGQLSVFGVFAVYLPELFPISLRSTGTSFCYNVGRIVAATAPFTMGRIVKSLGGNVDALRTAGLWVSLVLLVGIAVLPLLPETKGQPLPEE